MVNEQKIRYTSNMQPFWGYLRMTNLTLKNVPDELYQALKAQAGTHRRSINSEAIMCLERVLFNDRIDPGQYLTEVRRARKEIGKVNLTEETLRKLKSEGRK